VTAGGGSIRSCAHDEVNDHCPYPRPGTRAVRACALVSGVVGLVAALLLLGDYVVDNLYDANPVAERGWLGGTTFSASFSSPLSRPYLERSVAGCPVRGPFAKQR
jgi:hypothetical protein